MSAVGRQRFLIAISLIACLTPLGCNRSAPHDEDGDSPSSPETGTTQQSPDDPADDRSTSDPPPSAGNQVVLGDPSLTAGIPGEGQLTQEQIEAWLAEATNHVPLEVELPMGLSLAAANITGLDNNPMTRAKIELGRQLYFDRRLSADATVSCADCHHPDEGFTRHTQFGVGIGDQEGNRNSPVSYNRILSGPQFWDGRASSLEEQAVGPIANPIEMGNTHEACVATIENIPGYKTQFEKIFADGVTIDNVGRAIATFERAIVTGPAPYDYDEALQRFTRIYEEDIEDLETFKNEDPENYARYEQLLADTTAHPFSESAARGRTLFFSEKSGCSACHAGANFTEEQYHNLGVGMDADEPDLGRFDVTGDDKDKGAFKTPTLRNVALSAPYMHDGSQESLAVVIDWYAKGGHANPHLSEKVKKLDLTQQDKDDLLAFMHALTSDFPPIETGRLPE